ncbi:major facilitator superfamily domain-containing protein 6-like [Asterias rubens]|uniref:major facilitator superfamily domain-containing protein 6-like n=1 Tax=Asterias rubens TaxID=7604 RepID=UPI001455D10B|nr:major facilitator superfamily domain-containing protein 6-like [Asterias rubens]
MNLTTQKLVAAGETSERGQTGRCHIRQSLLPYKAFNLFLFGSFGCILPYMSIYFKQLGFNPFMVGLLNAVRPLAGFAILPFISVIADRFQCRKLVSISGVVIGAVAVLLISITSPAPEAPCDVMEKQIHDFLHLNISLPYEDSQQPLDYLGTSGDIVLFKNVVLGNSNLDPPTTMLKRQIGPDNNISAKQTHQFPESVETILLSDQSWLFDQDGLYRIFWVLLILSSFVDVSMLSSAGQCDTAALDTLRNEVGHADDFGWQRGYGSMGFGLGSLFGALLLNSTHTVKISCGIKHTVASYWTCFASAIVIILGAFITLFYFKFPKYKEEAPSSSKWAEIRQVIFSWHYGSVIFMIFIVGIAHGCIWGFLFWHLENLGATHSLLGMLGILFSVSEFGFTFFSSWAINKFGHIPLMTIGLLVFVFRFLYYGLITVPWMMVLIDIFHGVSFVVTWTTCSSYLGEAVPLECGGTMQGIIISMHQGLGAGTGYLISGLIVDSYGAQTTFLLYAAVCAIVLIWFVVIQVMFPKPAPPWRDDEDEQTQEQETLEKPASPSRKDYDQLTLKLPPFQMETTAINQQK